VENKSYTNIKGIAYISFSMIYTLVSNIVENIAIYLAYIMEYFLCINIVRAETRINIEAII
jgi:exosortase/archaeosortase